MDFDLDVGEAAPAHFVCCRLEEVGEAAMAAKAAASAEEAHGKSSCDGNSIKAWAAVQVAMCLARAHAAHCIACTMLLLSCGRGDGCTFEFSCWQSGSRLIGRKFKSAFLPDFCGALLVL